MITDVSARRVAHMEDALARKPTVELLASLVDVLLAGGDRPRALAAFERHAPAFAEGSPSWRRRLRALHERILWNLPAAALRTNLPHARHVIVGRNTELSAAAELLRRQPVTLAGAPGVGKSRLALEIGRRCLPDFPDGVWWIDLHGARAGTGWAHALAGVLDIPAFGEESAVLEALRQMQALLIFDGCDEQRASLADALERITESRSRSRALVSVRRPLGFPGEHVLRIEPLPVPQNAGVALDRLLASPAIQLFVERAAAADPRFTLNESNAAALARICRNNGGLPLAIELAACAVAYLPLEEIWRRSGESLSWSIDALPRAEREVLLRLSIFEAPFGFTEACAAGGKHTETALKRLIDSSLLHTRIESGGPEYYLLDSLRASLRGRLTDEERDAARRRLLCLYAEPQAPAAVANVHAAVESGLLQQDAMPLILQVLAARAIPLAVRGHVDDAASLCERALRLAGSADEHSTSYIETLRALAWLHNRRGFFERAIHDYEDAAMRCARAGDAATRVRVLSGLYIAAINAGDYTAASAAAQEALATADRLRDTEILAIALRCRAGVHVALGEFEPALPHYERLLTLDLERVPQSLLALGLHDYALAHLHLGHATVARSLAQRAVDVSRAVGDFSTESDACNALGAIELMQGRIDAAFQAYRDGLSLCSRPGAHPITRARSLEGYAASAMREDQLEAVAQLLGHAEQLRDRHRAPRNPFERGRTQTLYDALASRLGRERLQAALLTGRTRSFRDALSLAQTLRSGDTAPRQVTRFANLTLREREIALLAAGGRSNRDIAQQLHLSTRTVENHLAAIYKKLGVTGRAQLMSKD